MNKKVAELASLLLAVSIIVISFAGCGNKSEKSTISSTATTSAVQNNDSVSVYPLKTDVKLKYWVALSGNVSPNFKNLGDTPFGKELQAKTGVSIEFLHPALGQEKDAFNIMIASGDLPDIIEYKWIDFPGGPELAINDGMILNLNDTIDKFAPNLKQYLQSNLEIANMIKTDSGAIYGFPFIKGDPTLLTTYGLVMRGDWLKELNLQVPTTIDEWYSVLQAFKEKKNASAPFSYNGANGNFDPFKFGAFTGAFDLTKDFYLDNGKVKFGPYEAGYKDFLSTMEKWYNEGLLDKNFAMNDSKAMDTLVLNGQTGALDAYPGGTIGKYLPALQEKDPKADLVPVPYPALNKGDRPQFSAKTVAANGQNAAVISAKSKNIEIAVRLLDYGYSVEGNLLYNFGIEGTSYKMANGYPQMADEVLKNAEKLPISQAWSKYARAPYNGPFVQRKEYLEQYYAYQQQKDAVRIWSETDMDKHLIPPLSPSTEESTELARIITDVDTYVNEFTMKVIMGNESIDNFDKYIDQLKKMNIDKAIKIKQNLYDRFTSR